MKVIQPSTMVDYEKLSIMCTDLTRQGGRKNQSINWFDLASRQKESKQKNKQVIQPSAMVNYETLPSRCTDLT